MCRQLKLLFDQAYLNQRGLGYGESYLRGLEYNVIDGVAIALLRSTIKRKLVSFNIPVPLVPESAYKDSVYFFSPKHIPILAMCIINPNDTYLTNRLLFSGGFGIDILTPV